MLPGLENGLQLTILVVIERHHDDNFGSFCCMVASDMAAPHVGDDARGQVGQPRALCGIVAQQNNGFGCNGRADLAPCLR